MIRYIKQPDNVGCGPTAILNTMKWAGMPYTIVKDYYRLFLECRSDDGTLPTLFDYALREESRGILSVKKKHKPTAHQIKSWLEHPKQSVVILYWHKTHDGGHYALVTEKVDERYIIVNDIKTKEIINLDKIEKKIKVRRYAKSHVPTAWFLKIKD